MDATLLRNIGIAVGAAALAGSLAVAQFAGDPQAPAPVETPVVAAPLPNAPATETPATNDTGPVFETADAQAPPPASQAPLSFLVRFQGSGPLGQAQALATRGREAEARRAAESALARQSALRGLCFDRFTIGGAEMVLRPCELPAPPATREDTSRLWLTRLRAMSAVAYAEENATASPARTP